MTDKKTILKEKFVELGTKVPMLRMYRDELGIENANYITSINAQTSYKEFIVNIFDSDPMNRINVESQYLWVLDGLPFMIIKKRIARSFYTLRQESYTFNKPTITTKTKYSCEDMSVVFPTAIGPMKKKIEESVVEQNKIKDRINTYTPQKRSGNNYKTRLANSERDAKDGKCIKNGNEYTYPASRNSSLCNVGVDYFILQYKDIWVEISLEEKTQLLLDIEESRATEVLTELTTLDVSNIQQNKSPDNAEIKPWIRKQLEEMENRIQTMIMLK